MTFDLRAILVFSLAALVYAGLLPAKSRAWAIMVAGVIAAYWLQPPLPIRFSDYILPTVTIGSTVAGWWLTRHPAGQAQVEARSQDWWAAILIAGLIVGMSFMRYLAPEYRITASRPPSPLAVAIVMAGAVLLAGAVWWAVRRRWPQPLQGRRPLSVAILMVVGLFVVLKSEPLATAVARSWREFTGQDVTLAAPIDLAWLGFSFVAFRLIHTLRDRQTGLLPPLSLREYTGYVLFFPAYTAGPIDRAERFVTDFRALPDLKGMDAGRFAAGGWRILTGLFKKFVIADLLAQGVALTPANATQAGSAVALWVLLYGYGLRLFFDFAGYTDIAIGIGTLFGFRLPENFNRPYLKTNITVFWQSWHITLSNWARFYVFSPLSRWLLTRSWRPSSTLIVLAAQLATMTVIGLWHGFTWNFFVWGLWHGLGLFIHKQWSDRTRKWYRRLGSHPRRKRAWTAFAWFLTFQYVTLGWIWFALPTLKVSASTMARLFGFDG